MGGPLYSSLKNKNTQVYVGGLSFKVNAQFLLCFNEYVKFWHYKDSEKLDLTTKKDTLCGDRDTKLTLCDPSVEHAEDIEKIIKIYRPDEPESYIGHDL
jgi:hypothetical protein